MAEETRSPPKIRLESTPLRRMNTVTGSGRSERRKHSSVAAIYTPQEHHMPLKETQPAPRADGYRKLSIGSRSSPTSSQPSDRPKPRVSGISFNIPVVTSDEKKEEEDQIRSSSSPSPRVLSPSVLERPRSNELNPSPSPIRNQGRLTEPRFHQSDIAPSTPTPMQKNFDQLPDLQPKQTPSQSSVGIEDDLSVRLRELAAKEAELLEIKETIKNLTNKKRTMEMEFETLKKSVEKTLHQQVNSTTTARKSHAAILSPHYLRSPNKHQSQRSVSDHPLDDNFNSVTPSSSRTGAGFNNTEKKRSDRRQSGLWGIITQVDNYIQSEFERFNIVDANPANTSPSEAKMNESFYQVPDSDNIPSEENRIKKLLDSNGHHSLLPQSIRNVVDAVIYGSIDEEEEQQHQRAIAQARAKKQAEAQEPTVSRQDSKKEVELKDFSGKDDEWANDFSFSEE